MPRDRFGSVCRHAVAVRVRRTDVELRSGVGSSGGASKPHKGFSVARTSAGAPPIGDPARGPRTTERTFWAGEGLGVTPRCRANGLRIPADSLAYFG